MYLKVLMRSHVTNLCDSCVGPRELRFLKIHRRVDGRHWNMYWTEWYPEVWLSSTSTPFHPLIFPSLTPACSLSLPPLRILFPIQNKTTTILEHISIFN